VNGVEKRYQPEEEEEEEEKKRQVAFLGLGIGRFFLSFFFYF